MAIVRDFLLWLIMSLHVVGGAVLFRRYFPRESPWFGFLLPALALPLLLNFIEHFVALPSLLWLLPFTFLALLFVFFHSGYSWEGLRLPTLVFLGAFAFTFGVRCCNPDITTGSDGLTDLSVVLNYCHGEKIPPTDNWLPTMDYRWYYSFQHYAASVVKRLFNVDGGTAVNASHALLSALTAFVGAAAAYRLSGGRAWIALATVFMIEAAFTGSSAYLYLTEKGCGEWLPNNLSGGFPLRDDQNPLWHLLGYDTGHFYAVPGENAPFRRELQVSGFWAWRDEYHANSAGHFFTLFSVFSIIELLRRERANFPWICAILIPFLVVMSTMWLVVIDGAYCLSGLVLALMVGRRPGNWQLVVYAVGISLIALWPAFSELTSGPTAATLDWNPPELRTPFWEFIVQFWPVILLWLTLCFSWKQMPVAARWLHVVVPLALIFIELFNLEDDRYNTYEKMWGPVYSVGLICFFPLVVINRKWLGRSLAVVILFCALVSISWRTYNLMVWSPWGKGAFNLQGDGYLLSDRQKARMLQVLSQLRDATLLAGHCSFNFYECPALAVFSGNRCYIAWYYSEEHFGHGGESYVRTNLNNDFYDGKMSDPLGFLVSNNIAGVIIWPGDNIPDSTLATLKSQLAPTYQYEDCKRNGIPNAGVFLKRPLPVIQR